MSLQYSNRIISKQILEHITFRNKLQVHIARTFYNDNKVTTLMTQSARVRRAEHEMKLLNDAKKPRESKTQLTFLNLFDLGAPEKHHFLTFHWGAWWKHKRMGLRRFYEKHCYTKYEKLGTDLATAYWVLALGGRVKFHGHSNWIEKANTNGNPNLPINYDSDYYLFGIDLNGYRLGPGGINYICNLVELRWLSLRGCETIDDWDIDKLVAEHPKLQYFDISECVNITERSLEALYKMPNLKKLIITNFDNSASFELMCLMLEDVNPNLTCEILTPENPPLPEE